jgi:lipase (class 3)
MLAVASKDDIRKIGEPLNLLINQTSWPRPNYDVRTSGIFDVIRSGALAIVAHLSYCAIGSDERKHPHRAKVVPCRVYQRLLLAEDFDFVEVMRGLDFAGIRIVRTERFVAILVPVKRHNMILVGVRGTQFAYDWAVNLRINKRKLFDDIEFHAGFFDEAQELGKLIIELRFEYDLEDGPPTMFFAGHSLGGAVAALMASAGSYTYGSPRVCSASAMRAIKQPFAIRRSLDIVPHCPPSLFNYANFKVELDPAGTSFKPADSQEMYFFISWIVGLAMSSFLENHSMERYRAEVLEVVRQQPSVQPHWQFTELAI